MGELTTKLLIEMAYAVGIGLFVGLEREHNELSGDLQPQETPADHGVVRPPEGLALGARTFALLSLLGWAAAYGGDTWPWMPPVGLLVVGALITTQYLTVRAHGIGLTTEVAAVVTFVLGMLVHVQRPLAVALALATTLLLVSKPLVRSVLLKVRRVELTSTLQLLILLAIVLPLLPSEPSDPWNALPPRKIGLFVVLIGGISYVGYVLSRILGQRRSAGITGLVGGLTSSTAVTAAMSQVGRRQASMRVPGQMSVFIANAMMFARVLVVTAILSRDVALALLYPLAGMGLVMLGGAVWKWRRLGDDESDHANDADAEPEEPMFENPFALIPALKWGVILCGVLLLAAVAKEALGDSGLLVASAASGLADVDAITLAVTEQSADGLLSVGVASLAIAIAVISNTVVKGGIAYFAGGRAFGTDIAKVFATSIVVGGLVAARVLFL